MEATCFLRGQPLTTIPTSLSSLARQRWKNYHNVGFSGFKIYSDSEKTKLFDLSLRASGPIKASSSLTEANTTNLESKEEDLVFVAGATGKVGSRTVRELLKLGFRVRAGVRSAQRAETLVQSVKDMKLQNINEGTQAVEKLEIVECDLEKRDSTESALGNASVIICCIGASEKEVFDITGPYRIDYLATKNLIDAATSAKVNQFILVTSLGTNKFGFPAAVLNLFWGVLCWKRKAEEALIESGLNYAIVRPGGMERPTDAYKETHNLTLSLDDTLFGGQVSNLQVAELLACMAKNPQISASKIVEVVAETTAPLTPMEDLLQKIPYKRPYVPPPKKSVAAVEEKSVPTKPVTQEPTTPMVEETPPAKEKEVQPRPLSPYASYEDLKPPTSPTPTSPTPTYTTLIPVTKLKEVDSTEVSVEADVDISEVPVEEEEVKQVEEKKERPLSPFASYDNLKPPSSPSPKASFKRKTDSSPSPVDSDTNTTSAAATSVAETTSAAATSVAETASGAATGVTETASGAATGVTETASGAATGVTETASGAATRVTETASAGATSVTETASAVATSVTETASAAATSVTETAPAIPRTRPLSPFAAYPDLKPPTSPTPSSTGPKKTASADSASTEQNSELPGGNDVLKTADDSVNSTPSSVPEVTPVNNVPNTLLTSEDNTSQPSPPKPRPLSPYTMYEDMKPPTSPLPSPVINH